MVLEPRAHGRAARVHGAVGHRHALDHRHRPAHADPPHGAPPPPRRGGEGRAGPALPHPPEEDAVERAAAPPRLDGGGEAEGARRLAARRLRRCAAPRLRRRGLALLGDGAGRARPRHHDGRQDGRPRHHRRRRGGGGDRQHDVAGRLAQGGGEGEGAGGAPQLGSREGGPRARRAQEFRRGGAAADARGAAVRRRRLRVVRDVRDGRRRDRGDQRPPRPPHRPRSDRGPRPERLAHVRPPLGRLPRPRRQPGGAAVAARVVARLAGPALRHHERRCEAPLAPRLRRTGGGAVESRPPPPPPVAPDGPPLRLAREVDVAIQA